jgi:hypothetical protein
MRIEEGLLPEELNDLPWNPLEILDNPLNIEPTQPDSELVKPERRKSAKKGTKSNVKSNTRPKANRQR